MLKYGVEYGPYPVAQEIAVYILRYRLLTL